MSREDIRLSDRFDLEKSPVLLNGTQALVRLMLMQKARDRAAGLNTAGLVTGYRGSPLGAVDMQMTRASDVLTAADIRFQPGLNEDLAATALWGSQQAELRGEGRFDGVFGLWYGKGPGVDRTGDVMRHANMAGSSTHGGVLMAMGDDHTGESSTTLHQSDWAMVDTYMPVLSPAGVQEIIDLGLFGFALSRFAGVWAGLKCMKDTIEATAVVNGDPFAQSFVMPEFDMPPGGLNIRLVDTPVEQERRIIDYKRFAAEAFGHANKIDRRVWGRPGAKIGLVAAGKNWLDLVHALSLLGIGADEADRLGLTTYKVGMPWPLDMTGFHDWAEGLDLIIVVEEKRKLIEVQIKEAIFDDRRGRRVYGWKGPRGEELFPTRYALEPVMIAQRLGAILTEEGRGTDYIKSGLQRLDEATKSDNAPETATRVPYFCSGCPHNSSTKLPEGARAYAGIGCHYMVQWMDRETLGFTHMGGEGANWIGEAPFSTRDHVFQNLGDGTYNHSGVQAIRAALAAGTNITYKILFNDAVAMTGGQQNEGGLNAAQITRELLAMGVKNVALVYDEKEEIDFSDYPSGLRRHPRTELIGVERELQATPGVSAIVYVQTCAAEKRRRRKRGLFPDPDKRVYINTSICEGCGDCGVQSNCVSIVPFETPLGRKRAIDQSSCNKDFSCVDGFCPSFVTVSGAAPRKASVAEVRIPDLPEPDLPKISGTHNLVITGVGGTGVVTIGAVLAMAAHVDGKGAGMMEMAGLAQKGGAVNIHCRLANRPEDISAIRVATGEADAVIGGDLVVSAGSKTMGLMRSGRTRAVVNAHEIITGDFTRDTEFRLPSDDLRLSLQARLGQEAVSFVDASDIAARLLGDTIYSNMLLLGMAWQSGLVPLSGAAIRQSIRLNGASVEGNLTAFEIGRWAAADREAVLAASGQDLEPEPIDPVEVRSEHLVRYQDERLAERYRALLSKVADPDLRAVVAVAYHKVLAYKDEYEVARLIHEETGPQLTAAFDGDVRPTFHLAPPFLPGKDAAGRPRKREFGAWVLPLMGILKRGKGLRGTWADPFGRSAERRMERQLIADYEADIARLLENPRPDRGDIALEIAGWPRQVRGFGPVKAQAAEAAQNRRAELWKAYDADPVAKAAE